MDKELKKQLHRIADKPRPRPLMYLGKRNGKKVYMRKRDLSYWQLREKYTPPFQLGDMSKMRHILAPQHYLTPLHLRRQTGKYVVWGGLIAFAALWAILHVLAFISAARPV